MVPLSQSIILPTASGPVMLLSLNLMMARINGSNPLLREVEQLRYSSTKSTAANKVSTQYKKQCQIMKSLRNRKKVRQIIGT